jgi:hypothetical protein
MEIKSILCECPEDLVKHLQYTAVELNNLDLTIERTNERPSMENSYLHA